MSSTVTVTAKFGPAQTATATAFTDVVEYRVNMANNMLYLKRATGQVMEYDITAVATITATKSGNVYALTLS